eukprot:gene10781-13202_t
MGHRAKLGGALFLTLLFLGCCAVSYSFAWYHEEAVQPQTKIETDVYYFWTKFKTVVNENNDDATTTDYDGDDNKNVKQVFTVSLSFLTASAAAGLATAIFQIVGIISKSKFFRILSGIAALAAFALLGVSFFTFFKINAAFNDDNSCLNLTTDNNICHKFRSSRDDSALGITVLESKWGPSIGWFVSVGGLALSLISAITSFTA